MATPTTIFNDNAYLDIPRALAEALQRIPVPRTGQVLTSSRGSFTFITNRPDYPTQLTDIMPACYVDVHTGISVPYSYDEQHRLMRGVPIVIVLFVPERSHLEDLTASEVSAEQAEADMDIKTVFGDLEQVVNRDEIRSGICYRLMVVESPGVIEESLDLTARSRVHARACELWCIGWQRVRGS